MCHIFNIFKMLLLLQIKKHGNVTYAFASSRNLLQILLVKNFIRVNLGHRGQMFFLRKIHLLVQITWYGLVTHTMHSFYITPNLPRTLLKGAVSSYNCDVYKSIHFWNGNESENPFLVSNSTKNADFMRKWQINTFW